MLQELTGWSVDAETIRRLCHAEAVERRKTKSRRLDVAGSFKKASGDWELQIDAGKVNTEAGWRDVKVATFAVREPADPRTSEDYDRRDLPKPAVRHVIASIETVDSFGPRCQVEAEYVGLPDAAELTVLGNGAEWIWNLALITPRLSPGAASAVRMEGPASTPFRPPRTARRALTWTSLTTPACAAIGGTSSPGPVSGSAALRSRACWASRPAKGAPIASKPAPASIRRIGGCWHSRTSRPRPSG